MKKSDLIKELERIPGDPEMEIKFTAIAGPSCACEIERINEFPRPEIIIVEK